MKPSKPIKREYLTEKAKRSEITIAGHKVEVFQLPDGEYVMSQTQATKIIDKKASSIFMWLESEEAEDILAKASAIFNIPIDDNNRPIQAIPIKVASAYWLKQSILGNSQAQALMFACTQESLERRCDAAFEATKTEGEYESKAEVNYQHYWQSSRTFSKRCHVAFSHACWLLGVNPALVHDDLTKLVTGMTARQHRQLELVGNDPTIGLDHVISPEHLAVIAQAKLNFASYRVGTLIERLHRAVVEAKRDLGIGAA